MSITMKSFRAGVGRARLVAGLWLAMVSTLACGRLDPDIARQQGALTGTITVSGRVSNGSGVGIAGARVALNGTSQAVQSTNAGGNFTFTQLAAGAYSLQPTLAGCSFLPQVVNLGNVAADTTQDFTAFGATCSAGGAGGSAGTGGASGVGGAAGAAGGAGAAGAAGAGGAGGVATAPPSLNMFTLLASGTIGLGDRSRLPAGNVGAGQLSSGTPFTLIAGHDDVLPGELFGSSTELLDRTVAGRVHASHLTAPLATFTALSPFVAPPAVPRAAPFPTPGTTVVSVAPGATRTLAPGSFGAVTVQGTLTLAGALTLSGGVYQMASLNLGPGTTLTAAAPSVVRISGALTAADRVTLNVTAGLGARALRVVVGAAGASAAHFGADPHLTSLILVPSGTLSAGDRLILSGAAAAQAITIGNDGSATRDGGFGCSTSSECNDHNDCTQDTCADGFCTNVNTANGTACNDGNACTQTDACQAGACVGSNPVVCAAADQCHVAGVCNGASGACSNPSAANGTACNDGDPCTQTDSCQAGVCAGANPVACIASDACHLAGTCDATRGQCSNPAAPDGTTCPAGTCMGGVCAADSNLTILDSHGTTLFSTTVPTDNTFAYSVSAGDLGTGPGENRTIAFTPNTFPPGQRVVAYDFPYGLGADDEGGSSGVSDVLSGNWPCLPTQFASLQAPAGQTVTASGVFVDHVVRYVDGTCRAHVPLAPLLRELEAQIPAMINQLPSIVRDIASIEFFEVAQPQFRSRGSNLQMGILFEGEFRLSAGVNATLSLDPAFAIGLRPSDGLFTFTALERNVTTIGLMEDTIRAQVDAALRDTPLLQDVVNSALSPPLSQLISVLGLPAGSVNTACATPTPAAPSPECFNNITGAIAGAIGQPGSVGVINQLASQVFGPTNFTCDNTNQCRFHPVFQAVNILPDSLEIVLAPDLRNPSNPLNALTQLVTMFGPVGVSRTVQLGGQPFTISIDCSTPPVATSSGSITTVFTGSTDFGAGISCGSIAQFF
jgi:hypothetical protein